MSGFKRNFTTSSPIQVYVQKSAIGLNPPAKIVLTIVAGPEGT
jgi:hypothetical protein